ncbi:MAG: hypothetical protein IJZ38_05805 [Bacteroides sp.]|nr:hypothetical protein [Bacteroides sp.]
MADDLESCLIKKCTAYVDTVKEALGDDLFPKLLDTSLSGTQLYRRARKNVLNDLSADLRPRGIIGGLFHKISEDTFHKLVTHAVKAFDKNLNSELNAAVQKPLAGHEENVRIAVGSLKARKTDMENFIDDSEKEQKMLEEKLTTLDNKNSEIKASLLYCNTLLTQYLEIAQAEYAKEMEVCRQKLQSPNIAAEEKAWVMILMGLMERDRIAIFNER